LLTGTAADDRGSVEAFVDVHVLAAEDVAVVLADVASDIEAIVIHPIIIAFVVVPGRVEPFRT
jgi:hypothetical protein